MEKIPAEKYKVKLENPLNQWADGTLIVDATEGKSTYNHIPVKHENFHDDDVSWHVTLEHDGALCEIKFRGGKYHKNDHKITGGRAASKCFKSGGDGDPEDNWTADGEGPGGGGKKY